MSTNPKDIPVDVMVESSDCHSTTDAYQKAESFIKALGAHEAKKLSENIPALTKLLQMVYFGTVVSGQDLTAEQLFKNIAKQLHDINAVFNNPNKDE